MKAFLIIFLASSYRPPAELRTFVTQADGVEVAPGVWFCSFYGTAATVANTLRLKATGAGPVFVFDVADFRQVRA